MIISHRHRYIFIKTAKTAGTSVEIALSKYAGEHDVLTPCTPEDDALRSELGYPGPRNYRLPFTAYSLRDLARAAAERRLVGFYNHIGARAIRERVGPRVWSSYFKFCFERNPWDKVVSAYYFNQRTGPTMSLSEYVQSGAANEIAGYELYTIRGEIAVDEVFRYESLEESMRAVAQRLHLPETPVLPRAKGQYRPPTARYREVLTAQDRAKIARVYAREIATFGYEW